MNTCFHCGKKGKLISVDEKDEKRIYLCRTCHTEEHKILKKKMMHAKEMFRY